VIIGEHEVALGTAAATAIAPSFDGELEGEDAALKGQDAAASWPAAPRRSDWVAMLARLATPSRDLRPRCPQHPGRLHSDYLAGARMAREMGRL